MPDLCPWPAKRALKLLREDTFCRFCRLLGNDVRAGLDSHGKDRLLSFKDSQELVDVAAVFLEYGEEKGLPLYVPKVFQGLSIFFSSVIVFCRVAAAVGFRQQ